METRERMKEVGMCVVFDIIHHKCECVCVCSCWMNVSDDVLIA